MRTRHASSADCFSTGTRPSRLNVGARGIYIETVSIIREPRPLVGPRGRTDGDRLRFGRGRIATCKTIVVPCGHHDGHTIVHGIPHGLVQRGRISGSEAQVRDAFISRATVIHDVIEAGDDAGDVSVSIGVENFDGAQLAIGRDSVRDAAGGGGNVCAVPVAIGPGRGNTLAAKMAARAHHTGHIRMIRINPRVDDVNLHAVRIHPRAPIIECQLALVDPIESPRLRSEVLLRGVNPPVLLDERDVEQ